MASGRCVWCGQPIEATFPERSVHLTNRTARRLSERPSGLGGVISAYADAAAASIRAAAGREDEVEPAVDWRFHRPCFDRLAAILEDKGSSGV
jgi:hypothetical protein